ncbi:MAG: FlgK, partial [Thermoleophilia bacterium]|nr:FlgK [Thermoleophilia bacterium]
MYKSTFMGLNTALRGVLAQQAALDTTGHNISNIETTGYTRQRAEMRASQAWSNPSAFTQTSPGQIGTGVEVLSIERLRDQYIDQNVRQQLGGQAANQTLVDQLGQVQAAFQEPSTNGLSKLLTEFFSAADEVAKNPQESGARQGFASAAEALARGFNQVSADLNNVMLQSDARLNDTVGEINGITSRIAALNTDIKRAIEHGHQPNDLLDARDLLMDDLSKITNYTSTTAADGQVTITFGTFGNIVDPTVAGGSTPVTRADLDAAFPADMTSGRAFADQQLFVNIIPGYLAQLDALATEIVVQVNATNAAGFTATGAAGGNIFDPLFTSAAAMSLDGANSIMLDPRRIAAADSWGGTGEPLNGNNFINLVNTVRGAGNGALGGQTFEQYYSSLVTALGSQAQAAERNVANADVLVDMAVGRR